MLVSLTGTGPLYQQIYRSLRTAILSGRLRSGDRLPVTRTLATGLNVSRNVVLIAYEQLIAEGYAVGHVGSGTFVAAAIPDSMLHVPSVRGLPAFPPHSQLPASPPTPAEFLPSPKPIYRRIP